MNDVSTKVNLKKRRGTRYPITKYKFNPLKYVKIQKGIKSLLVDFDVVSVLFSYFWLSFSLFMVNF